MRRWYESRQAYEPRTWVTALLVLVSAVAVAGFTLLLPGLDLLPFLAVCLALGAIPVQAQWMLWRRQHPIIETEPEIDPDLSFIEHVRLRYNAVANLNRVVERTDRMSLAVFGIVAVGLFVWGVLTSFAATIAVVVAFMSGVHIATVLAYRRLRRHTFEQLKDGYQEIELQNIVEEEG